MTDGWQLIITAAAGPVGIVLGALLTYGLGGRREEQRGAAELDRLSTQLNAEHDRLALQLRHSDVAEWRQRRLDLYRRILDLMHEGYGLMDGGRVMDSEGHLERDAERLAALVREMQPLMVEMTVVATEPVRKAMFAARAPIDKAWFEWLRLFDAASVAAYPQERTPVEVLKSMWRSDMGLVMDEDDATWNAAVEKRWRAVRALREEGQRTAEALRRAIREELGVPQ